MISLLKALLAEKLMHQGVDLHSLHQSLGLPLSTLIHAACDLEQLGMQISWDGNYVHCPKADPLHSLRSQDVFHWHLPFTSSSQDLVMMLHARHPMLTVISTDFQSHGRGQFGRKWRSGYGQNLLFSAIMSLRSPLPLSLLIGYLVKKSIEHCVGSSPIAIKWPNDLIVENQKIAGILIEPHPHQAHWVVGIGINFYPDTSLHAAFNQDHVSIKELFPSAPTRQDVMHCILMHLHEIHAQPKALKRLEEECRAHFHEHDALLNKPIHATSGDQAFYGIGRGIDPEGRYMIETSDGSTIKISSASIRIEHRKRHHA